MVLRRLCLLLLVSGLTACGRADTGIIGPGMGYDPGSTHQPATPHYASDHYVPTAYTN